MNGHSLDVVMTPERSDDTDFTWMVPDGWQQGRGAFGGIVVGALLRAIQQVETDPARTVRSVTAELVGPVLPGAARIQVEILRRGNAVTTVRAWLSQSSDEILAHAVVVLGAARTGTPTWAPPDAELPALAPIVDLPPAVAPVFAQHFVYRPTGPYPFGSHPIAEASGYVQTRAEATRFDAAYVAAHADAYWLAAMATFDRPRPAATVAFTLHLQGELDAESAAAPLFHRARSESSVDGYASETRRLYTSTGQLLAINHQLVAIIK